jgi:protein-S-isoprenylcysteine O-methyltransferase Ste14
MPDETPLRVGLILALGAFFSVRVYYRVKTRTLGKGSFPQDNKVVLAVLLSSLVLTFSVILTWLRNPGWTKWSALSLPGSLRWTGAVLSLAAAPLLMWVHHALGASYSAKLEIRQHTLVTAGPYRWVRHPMYSTILLWTVGLSLTVANWLTFFLPVAFALFAILRVPNEERMMIETYGEAYREYVKHTGRFLPTLIRRN